MDAPEKAAPIPAEVLATARNSVADQVAKEGGPGSLVQRIRDGKKDDWLVPTAVAAILADRASQEERIREDERAEAREQRSAALMDCQYVAGAQAGWNCAQADNPNEAFAALIKSRDGRIAALKQARERLRGDAS